VAKNSKSLDFILAQDSKDLKVLIEHKKNVISELWGRFSIETFEQLLETNDIALSSDGIFILAEIGDRGCKATDLALRHMSHPWWTTRYEIVSHLLSCNCQLSVDQIHTALNLICDDRVNVRCLMMEVLLRLGAERVERAQKLFPLIDNYEIHERGRNILRQRTYSIAEFEEELQSYDPIIVVYAGARLLDGWRCHEIEGALERKSLHFEITYLNRRRPFVLKRK
jgi:hypothetical protein